MGGYKVQRDEIRLLDDAKKIEDAGAFSVVLEGIPGEISSNITKSLSIPTIGIGAGSECDGQILVLHDLLGIHDRHLPKFVKQYANLKNIAQNAIEEYISETKHSKFPAPEHVYKK